MRGEPPRTRPDADDADAADADDADSPHEFNELLGVPPHAETATSERLLAALSADQKAKHAAAKRVFAETSAVDAFSDATVLRFLTFHRWNAERAHAQMRKRAAWPRKAIADAARARFLRGGRLFDSAGVRRISAVTPFCPEHLIGAHGDLCVFISLGAADVDLFMSSMTKAEFEASQVELLEWLLLRCDQLSCAAGRLVSAIQFFDCHGIGLKHVHPRVLWRLRDAVQYIDKYYPDVCRAVMATHVFHLVTKVYNGFVKPLLSRQLQERIYLVSPERSARQYLGSAGAAALPACYGGAHARLPTVAQRSLGLDGVGAAERATYFRGDARHLGGYLCDE